MNFLSHYYFNRFTNDELFVVGSVLPDLVRNADPTIKIHPDKDPVLDYKKFESLLAGWTQHIEIDAIFHDSQFFRTHTEELRKRLQPILAGTPFKAFFVAHISLELIIDFLLIKHKKVDVTLFYDHLEHASTDSITGFLNATGKVSPVQAARFTRFYHTFGQHAYLHSYKELSGICYAVVQICKRIWPLASVPKDQEDEICVLFEQYAAFLDTTFLSIFEEIQKKLS